MPLIQLMIILVLVGVVLWVINNYIPMRANVKKILNVVVAVVVMFIVLNSFGIIGSTMHFRISKS